MCDVIKEGEKYAIEAIVDKKGTGDSDKNVHMWETEYKGS
jgi:hypothetical protein